MKTLKAGLLCDSLVFFYKTIYSYKNILFKKTFSLIEKRVFSHRKKGFTYSMNKNILKLAIPNIISNITVPLLGMVDLAIVGHIGNERYIAAIALGGMIFNFIYWNFGFLRMSTSGFTAQAYGAKDRQKIMLTLLRSVSISLLVSLCLLLLQYPIALLAKQIIKSDIQTLNLALDYFYIRIWAVPATLTLYVVSGWFIGMQNAKTPMYIAIFANLMNIICSLIFVIVFHLDIKGVAWGTVIAQYSGLLLALILWFKKYSSFIKEVKTLSGRIFKEMHFFFKVNIDIFLRNACVITVFTFIPYISAAMGDMILAVNSLLLQLFMLFSYIMDGFAYAGEALTGRFIGAKDNYFLRKTIHNLLKWGALLAFLFTIIYFFWGEDILYLLTNNEHIVAASSNYLIWTILIPIAGFAAFIFDGIYVGATASKAMRNIVMIATTIFFLVFYLSKEAIGNNGIWIALLIFLVTRSALMWIFNTKFIVLRED